MEPPDLDPGDAPPAAEPPAAVAEGRVRRPIRRDAKADSRIVVATATREADFAAARRNTRRVRRLLYILPVVAVAGAVAFVIATRSGPELPAGVEIAAVEFGPEGETVIEAPRLTGYQAGGEAYELRAARAMQRPDEPDRLTLEAVEATLELPGGDTAFFTAPAGAYNAATSLLTLTGGIDMRLQSGLVARLDEMVVDVPAGLMRSDRPFEMTLDTLTVRGNALEMDDDRVRITGGVETVLRGGFVGTATSPAPQAAAPGGIGPAPEIPLPRPRPRQEPPMMTPAPPP